VVDACAAVDHRRQLVQPVVSSSCSTPSSRTRADERGVHRPDLGELQAQFNLFAA